MDPDEAAADYYYVPITLSDNGQVDIDIDADVAKDEAANDNTAAATFSFIYDSEYPTLAITAKSEQNNNLTQGDTYNGDGYIEFTFTLNDANPDLTALTRGDINEFIDIGFNEVLSYSLVPDTNNDLIKISATRQRQIPW